MSDNRITDAEMSVVGGIISDPDACMPEAMILNHSDFEHKILGDIFQACKNLYMKRQVVSVAAVVESMALTADEKVLLVHTADTGLLGKYHIKDYVKLTKEAAMRRRALDFANHLVMMLTDKDPIEDCQTMAAAIPITLSMQADNTVPAARGLRDACSRAQHKRKYISTGFTELDKGLYLSPGNFCVIGARPSVGKTAFGLQVAAHMAYRHKVTFFSLETSPEEIYDRVLAFTTDTSFTQINRGEVSNESIYEDNKELLHYLDDLDVVDAAGWNVAQIAAKAIQNRSEVVFIDYLGLINGDGNSLYERVTKVSNDLHTLAMRQKILVIALAQLNRSTGGEEPTLASLRDSGAIEQDADHIIFLHRLDDHDSDSNRRIRVAKTKKGRVVFGELAFDGEHQRFSWIDRRA